MSAAARKLAEWSRDYESLVRSTNMNIFLLSDGEDPAEVTSAARGAQSLERFSKDNFVGTADEISEQIDLRVRAGINYIITYFPRVAYDQAMLRRFAEEVIPRFS